MNAAYWASRLGSALLAALVCTTALANLLGANVALGSDVDVYYAKTLHTAAGDPIQDAAMVVTDGKITALGTRDKVEVPAGANVHDLGSKVIIPGLVIAQSGLADGSSDVDRAITPYISALDGFDFFADRSNAFQGGVTTVQLSPGAGRLVSGVGAVVKLTPGEKSARVLSNRESLRVVLTAASRNPPTIYEPPVGPVSEDRPILPTQPQLSSSLAGAASGLRTLFRVAREQASAVHEAEEDLIMDALVEHIAASGSVRFDAATPAEIRLAMQIAAQSNLPSVLVHPQDLSDFSEDYFEWKKHLRGVLLQGKRPGDYSNPSAAAAGREIEQWESARELIDAGFALGIYPADDDDFSDMLFIAGQFMQDDLSRDEVLCAVTCWPAALMGVDDQVGSLAVGRNADFVVLTDEPFAVHSTVWSTYVDGEPAYEREPAERTTVIRAGSVYSADGKVLSNAAVVVKGKTLRDVGEDVSAPLDATIREYPNAVIVPGFIDLGANVGTAGASLGNNLNLQSDLASQIDAADPAIAVARETGVTTVLLGGGGNNPSPLVAFKLGDDARVISNPVAVRFPLTGNLVSRVPAVERALAQGKAYHERWNRYEVALAEYEARQAAKADRGGNSDNQSSNDDADEDNADDQEQQTGRGGRGGRGNSLAVQDGGQGRGRRGGQDGGQDDGGDDAQDDAAQDQDDDQERDKDANGEEQPPARPEKDDALEPYRALFSGEIPAFVEARTLPEIEAALKIFRNDNDIRTILVGVDDLARFPEMLDGERVNVCAGPELVTEGDSGRINIPQILANDQIGFGFRSEATTGVRDLPRAVQFAVNQGLGTRDALRGLTFGAASLLSDKASFGALETGKDADLVILSGPPFELSTKVLAVMIDGQWVYEKEDGR